MKLSYLIENVRKDRENSSYVSGEELFEEFGFGSFYAEKSEEFENRIKAYWLQTWYCTDTWVGLRVYFFDNEPFAVSFQSARKNSENFSYLSKESYDKVRQFLLTQLHQPDVEFINADQEEMEEGYEVSYSGQLLDNIGFYNGRKCQVVSKFCGYNQIDKWERVVVKFEDTDETLEIDMKDFQIPWRIS